MIKACLRIEMRKALVNKAAMISCTGAIFLAVRHAVNAIILYENEAVKNLVSLESESF